MDASDGASDGASNAPHWPLAIEHLPGGGGPPPQLIVLLHGWRSAGRAMKPLADALHAQFPLAAILAPDAPTTGDPLAPGERGRPHHQWYSVHGLHDSPSAWPARVAGAMPSLVAWLRAQQQRLGVSEQATAVAGFSQGGVMALHLAQAHDGLAGRVLAFNAHHSLPPEGLAHAPTRTTVHLLHGEVDEIFPQAQVRARFERLAALGADATLDIASGVGHTLHTALIDQALHRLTHHIPQRTWREALGGAATG